MNDELADLFLRRGWRYFHHEEDSAYLLDAGSEYLSAVPATLLASSSTAEFTADVGLREAVRAWSTDGGPPKAKEPSAHQLQLGLLGGRILVRFASTHCRKDVARHFSCSIDETGSSPDVLVECDWEEADRHLFRARPDHLCGSPLAGVRVQALGDDSPHPWLSSQPPLPPLSVAPFSHRFLALHAAVVREPGGSGIAFVGPRNSGKTTCALEAGRHSGFELVGDETAFVHIRTAMAEPFPHAVSVRTGDSTKASVPAGSLFPGVARGPTKMRQIVVLEPGDTSGPHCEKLSPAMAMRALLPHQRDASAPLDEGVVTLDHLARNVPTWRLRCRERACLWLLLHGPALRGESCASQVEQRRSDGER